MHIPRHTQLEKEKKKERKKKRKKKKDDLLLPDTPENKTLVTPRRNSLTDSSLTGTPKSSLSFGQERWRLPGSGLSTEEALRDQEHLHLS